MFKIGEFSKLTQISIRMLRHYDELGLLKPAHIDAATGYRFYTAQQLPRLNRIRALQDLGLSLEQISRLLQEEVSAEQFKGMLLLKQAEVMETLAAEQEKLARIALRLQQIEMENQPSAYDVRIKNLEAQWVAGVRDTISSYERIGFLMGELFEAVPPSMIAGVAGAAWHDEAYRESDIDAEALVGLRGPIESSERVKIYEQPPMTVMSVVHQGPVERIEMAYQAVIQWIEAQGYRIAGANREWYVQFRLPPQPNDESTVIEIQFPVTKENPDGQD